MPPKSLPMEHRENPSLLRKPILYVRLFLEMILLFSKMVNIFHPFTLCSDYEVDQMKGFNYYEKKTFDIEEMMLQFQTTGADIFNSYKSLALRLDTDQFCPVVQQILYERSNIDSTALAQSRN